jgi:hypothetical protein
MTFGVNTSASLIKLLLISFFASTIGIYWLCFWSRLEKNDEEKKMINLIWKLETVAI